MFKMTGAALAAFVIAVPATAVQAADPAPTALSGDGFEQMTIAMLLAEQCKAYRGFEFMAVEAASRRAWASAGAKSAADSAAAAASKSSTNPDDADKASAASRAAHMAGLRQRASAMGCDGGLAYLQNGFVTAYTALGATLTTAWAYRGQAQIGPGFTALTMEEKQLVAAFASTAQAEFGANWTGMETQFSAEAQRRLSGYAGQDPAVAAAYMMGEQREAFAAIRMESAVVSAGYTARGAIIADDSPYGFATLILRKDGAPTHIMAAEPKAIGHAPDDAKSPRGYIAFAVRADGSGVIGLFGEDVRATAANLTAGMKNRAMPGLTATAFTDHCPFEKCFAIPAERLRAYAKDRETLTIYASTQPTPAPPAFELYALQVYANDVRAATAAVSKAP